MPVIATEGETTQETWAAVICASSRTLRWVPVGTSAPLVTRSSQVLDYGAEVCACDAWVDERSKPRVRGESREIVEEIEMVVTLSAVIGRATREGLPVVRRVY